MENDIKLSVIMPVHNVERYLPGIIEELKRQENDAMEVVCIDDGSADGSPAVLDAIDDPHFVVIHQANAGVAAARNHGLDVARGEYLCFIDPDDHISDGYITALTNAAEAGEADLMVTDWAKCKPDGIEEKRVSGVTGGKPLTAERVLEILLHSDVILGSLWAKTYSAKLFEGNRFPAQKTSSDFIPSVTAMSRAKQVKYIPNIEYMYTADRSDSLQNSQKAQDIADSVHVHVQFEELLEQRYPSLLAAAQLDLLLARVQACIHICKSVNIPTSQKKGLYHKYAHGMMHDFGLVWGSNLPVKEKILFTITASGYYPTTLIFGLKTKLAALRQK
ncbi:hypothetical protein BAAM0483_09035 [Bifidobacterium animalis subsp. animalis MCC 0483]|uniref:Glycosyltransferase 2-like domain-containing protein n=1 Tax=Bifidobacterium animalis subsp. animalis MCC 0483 TaxID=1365955 RepID=A0AB34T6Q0_9BIFI|nr:glycosyltransferase [Bifidobacterium animalis]ANU43093.1 hypothetical protein A4U98_00300 [Bifidobacterium animalis subsp. animalis]KOA47929.1 hypothetical protein BAAM0483_09035 [Bifidobacterium animalis subsp. animalis MCC 0483]PHQ53697.1 hypothetical protein ADH71_005555 [Bifidobacterium animalis subsp. animalis]QQQ90741.1 glycosyltransferase [Bifidobacterium animalis]UQE62763.1 glycosyltransferase [Bifidobacterium animalis]